jgi:hypothetical protein
MSSGPATTPCPNCGEAQPGKYCPNCGQRQGQRVLSVRRILLEALDDQFSLNSALPRTLGKLIARPGYLTNEYLSGRIAHYVPPFRLYLATSIMFFLMLSLLTALRPTTIVNINYDDSTGRAQERPVRVEAVRDAWFGIRYDTAGDTTIVRVNFGNDHITRRVVPRVERLARMGAAELSASLSAGLIERAPAGMFVLLPVFSALLYLLYIRSGRYYIEHFIFSLHTHAFTFLCFTVAAPLSESRLKAQLGPTTIEAAPAVVLLILWLLVYYFIAMRRMYRQGVILTLTKYIVLATSYMALLILVVLGIAVAALLLG